jgi:DNA-binding SARP family transcriptional activator
LRTTLCRLRRAVSDAAGCDAARYVSVDNSIALDLDWVSIDARSFRAQVELAETASEGGNWSAARDHYLQAERLHIGMLLGSEALEPQLVPRAVEFEDLFKVVVAQLGKPLKRNAELAPSPRSE